MKERPLDKFAIASDDRTVRITHHGICDVTGYKTRRPPDFVKPAVLGEGHDLILR
ncbi:MAG: hypothetical protein H0V07_00715 [Propionibacteriales bacterium]|nr:hypothetical protein [Propionibacteriales bacterium]